VQLVFDTEADGFLDQATQLWCISTWELGTGVRKHFGPDQLVEGFNYLYSADELIGHNILGYDFPLMEKLYGWVPKQETVFTDTVVRSRLLRSDRPLPYGCSGNVGPHSLEAWGYRVGKGKPSHDDWSQYSPEMKVRCDDDVEINVLTYYKLEKEAQQLIGIDWTQSQELEHAITPIITEQELNGCPLDLPLVFSTWLELEARIRKTDETLVPLIPQVPLPKSKQGTWPKQQYKKDGTPTVNALRYYGDGFGAEKEYRTDLIVKTAPINLGSPGQVKDYLLTIGWVPLEWNYKKDPATKRPMRDGLGNKIKTSPKLTLESLESCTFPAEHQEMGKQLTQRQMMAHRRSMLKGFMRDVRSDGKISARALPLGTPTGRMTHREVVNVPGVNKGEDKKPLLGIDGGYGYELRSCFGTLPGYKRVGVDLRSCQIYGLAHYMRDEEYKYQVIEGDHHQYAADLAGLKDRQDGKKLNYSILFGASDEKLASDLGITKQQAAAVRLAYFKGLPLLDALLKKLTAEWKRNGYIVGLDGRAVWVRAQHMLLVYLLQTLESVVMKNFIVDVYRSAKQAGLDFMLVTTMHDECQWLVKEEHVVLFTAICEEAIQGINRRFNLWCEQAIDINIGSTWAECH